MIPNLFTHKHLVKHLLLMNFVACSAIHSRWNYKALNPKGMQPSSPIKLNCYAMVYIYIYIYALLACTSLHSKWQKDRKLNNLPDPGRN